MSPQVRSAVNAVLFACFQHPDPNVRSAREKLYAAVTFWPEHQDEPPASR